MANNHHMAGITVEHPSSVQQALACLAKSPAGSKILAGGTDIMVDIQHPRHRGTHFIDISGIDDLRHIHITETQIKIGALVTYQQILDSSTLQKEFPNIVAAARETGAVAIQNRGTIGGNIANASPAADTPPALLSYDSKVVLASAQKERECSYECFHLSYKKIALEKHEIIKEIVLNRRAEPETKNMDHRHFFRKVGTRKAQAISKTVIACTAILDGSTNSINSIKIAFGSVAPKSVRCHAVEAYLIGAPVSSEGINHACKLLTEEISPIDDIRSNQDFRRCVSQNILKQFLEELRK